MRKPQAIFMAGGPGAGKSYIRKREYADLPVVDCDSFKESHPDYDPNDPAALHAWSQEQCTKDFFRRLGGDDDFVYDSTGTNAEKLVDWIMRAQSAGFEVTLVYVRCPMPTALKRNAERDRNVPEHIVREKHEVIETSVKITSEYADRLRIIDNG